MTALGMRYLRGYAVAADLARQGSEWPPHPGRVFMALAATLFETGNDPAERKALQWLEQQVPPALSASDSFERSFVETYVPVNDAYGGITWRARQPRTFPTVRPRYDSVFLIWNSAAPEEIRTPLDRLCQKVTRVGHSSSLVQMWLDDGSAPLPNWIPADKGSARMRVASKGTLANLEKTFARENFEKYTSISEAIAFANGKEKTRLKRELEHSFPSGVPKTVRPVISKWQGYSKEMSESAQTEQLASSPFDSRLIIFSKFEGSSIGLESTRQLTGALRDAAMSTANDPIPEWLSGHHTDGSPTTKPHAAFFPLPFVDAPHADGHIMGVAMAIPRTIPEQKLKTVLSKLLFDQSGDDRQLDLWRRNPADKAHGNDVWRWTVEREKRAFPPINLKAQTWTKPSKVWASVTPVVLHHYPKKGRDEDVERILRAAFASAHLPEPETLTVQPVSVFTGAGHARSIPDYTEGGATLCRYQVHVIARFACQLEGPVLVGRGRFRGYGLFRPFQENQSERA